MARDVRVRISGDSGDLVRATAEAAASLELLNKDATTSSRGMGNLERSLGSTGKGARTFSRLMDDATISSHRTGADILKTSLLIDEAGNFLNTTSHDASLFERILGGVTGAFQPLVGVLGTSVPLFGTLGSMLAILPPLIIAVVAAVVALVDIFGTLVAVVADFVAPLTLVAGLLGALGLGFVIAAKRAAAGGGVLGTFKDKLDALKSMFGHTSTVLAKAFLPYLDKLAGAAQQALLFIDKLAQMPLAQAMKTMATQGVQMIGKFVNAITAVVARPIRLAFKIAFGTGKGGNEISSQVSDWWNRFTDYLFGYTVSHPVKLDGRTFRINTQHVDGIFQPLIDWFNRHHFTKQGIEIGHDILKGLMSSGMQSKLTKYFSTVFNDALKTSLKGMGPKIAGWLTPDFGQIGASARRTAGFYKDELGRAFDWVKGKASSAWDSIRSHASSVLSSAAGSVRSKISGAWDAVKTHALAIWNEIVAAVESALTVHINWPSVPSSITSVLNKIPHFATGGIVTHPTIALVGERGPEAIVPLNRSHGMGGGVTIIVQGSLIHQNDLADLVRKAISQGVRTGNTFRPGGLALR